MAFALLLGLRAGLVGLLVLAAGLLLLNRFPVLAATAVLAAAFVVHGIARAVGRSDAALRQFLDGLAANAFERPTPPPPGFGQLDEAIGRALQQLRADREQRQRQVDHLQVLADTVTAALLVVEADGAVTPANRAAVNLVRAETSRLDEIAGLTPEGAERLRTLAPGGRILVSLADGRQALAAAAHFRIPGEQRRRLISLQSVAGELDAVEQKAWRDLVRVLAHEMANSLTTIASLSESASRLGKSADPELGEALEAIEQRSVGLMSFIARYRAVAEVPRPRLAPLALAKVATQTGRLMSAELRKRGIACEVVEAGSDQTVMADRSLLEQALINLVKNAADAAAGGPEPGVWISCVDREDGRVAIEVADNGPGLAETSVEDIFVPFYSTKADGTGIGLSLARQIALSHAGQIEVRANQPAGAVFSLVLPAAPQEEPRRTRGALLAPHQTG